MTATAAAADSANGHITGYGTKSYRNYVLLSLTLVYTLNFIDRTIMTVVGQEVIRTFGLSDFEWGLLAGPPFAIFYALCGIPIAMWADRSNRVRVIAICVVLWSLMTVLCGFATSFLFLLLFRIGVAVGEAGCTPPANSLIGDYYPPKARAGALGIYSMGVTIGGTLAFLFGGPLAGLKGEDFGAWIGSIGLAGLFGSLDWSTVEGWRIAFVAVGLPGIVVAIVLWLTIKEPPRGYSEPPTAVPAGKAGIQAALQELLGKPSFWWMSLGASLVAFVGYGLVSFQTPFLQRAHGFNVQEASLYYGAPLSLAAAGGTFLGGWLSERFSPRSPGAPGWITAAFLMVSVPFYIIAFFVDNAQLVFALWLIAAVCHYAYLSAQYMIGQGVVSPQARASSIAILLVIVSLIGNGIGPPFVGAMSDMLMNGQLASLGGDGLTIAVCKAGEGLTSAQQEICAAAYSGGLRQSMAATVLFLIPAAFGFYMASRSLRRDLYSLQQA
jgi:MFS family permease